MATFMFDQLGASSFRRPCMCVFRGPYDTHIRSALAFECMRSSLTKTVATRFCIRTTPGTSRYCPRPILRKAEAVAGRSMLKFNGAWRFHSPGAIADGVQHDFFNLIRRIAAQGSRQRILETFKSHFANAMGSTSSWSSNESWSETDLYNHMNEAATNAPLFIEAFYDACTAVEKGHPDFTVPNCEIMNSVLAQHNAGYEVQPPNLLARNPNAPISIPKHVRSLDEEVQEIIQQSLRQSDEYMNLGKGRQAVQEILWLLETVSTIYEGVAIGDGTVQGKYFNKIAEDLRRHQRGTTFEQVMNWATTLHGYLSSPTGGGVRHGANLKAGVAMQQNEARLFCNLIRSYITFLLAEHERLTRL